MKRTGAIVWSSSAGIASNDQLRLFFPGMAIQRINTWSRLSAKSSVLVGAHSFAVGWGNKANTLKAKVFAGEYGLPYVRLEDGFIGYLGHPSTDKNRLSLIKDDVGIYYDARQPSRLERLCLAINRADNFSATDNARAQTLIQQITTHGISKYNHARVPLPQWLTALNTAGDGADCILLVDQTAGDQSIVSGLASAASFQEMLQAALTAHPDKPIVIKTHPDVLITGKGGKRGHFSADQLPSHVHLLTDDCLIPELMAKVSDVYVVTSQLGFEALLFGKQVHCFGLPFYAGWGLTHDQQVCDRRSVELTLPQLVYASLVQYPTYLHPEREVPCEVEEVVDWLVLQLEPESVEVCYAVGFSLWKRAFVKQFVGRLAGSVIFVENEKKLELLLAKALATNPNRGRSVLLWGRGRAEWAKSLRHPYREELLQVWFMEDGFLRSVGLGADLRRPSCLVIDRQGMYYDSSENSDVIDILKAIDLTAAQQSRADTLVADIRRLAITKYNVGRLQDSAALMARIKASAKVSDKGSRDDSEPREIIIVPGQFENDLSIACSLGEIKTNIALLAQVRADYPEAFIIFKEHPDVYSGVRPGALGEQAAKQFADLYMADVDMDSLLACADRVCTLTSLTGFEALLRNKAVTVYGSPFYAGWGLTTDKLALPGRFRAEGKSLSLSELVYGAMIEYSRYVDWKIGALTGPEQTVAFLAHQRGGSSNEALKSGWLVRQGRKFKYFIDTYFF
jgi:capsular polysaccharide export protein